MAASWCQVTAGQRAPKGVWWREGSQDGASQAGGREAAGCRAGGVSLSGTGLLYEGQENEPGKGREKRKEGEGSGRESRCGPPSEEDSQDSPTPPRDAFGDHSRKIPECQPHLVQPICRHGGRPGRRGVGVQVLFWVRRLPKKPLRAEGR